MTAINLDALQALDAIERKGTFSAAARSLHRVPSALTYQVHKLEQALGVALFDRSGHRASLTEAGTVVLERGRALLMAAEELSERARLMADGYEPELRIAVDSLYPLHRLFGLVAKFQQACPEVNLKLSEEVLGGGLEALAEQRADIVIGTSLNAPVVACSRRPLGTLDVVLAAAPTHPLARCVTPVDEEELRRHVAVVTADSSRSQAPLSVGLLDRQRRLTVDSIEARIRAQVAGLGVGWLPRFRISNELRSGALVEIETPVQRPGPETALVWRVPVRGRGMKWWLDRFESEDLFALLTDSAGEGD